LADARGTLGFRETPVENHCPTDESYQSKEDPSICQDLRECL